MNDSTEERNKGLEAEALSDKYAKSVDGWAVYGYHAPLTVNGEEYPEQFGYLSGGKFPELLNDVSDSPISNFEMIMGVVGLYWGNNKPGYEKLSHNIFVSVVDIPEKIESKYPNDTLILFGIFHDNTKSNNGRAGQDKLGGAVALKVPASIAKEFAESVRKYPELAEKVYEKALSGIDSKGEKTGLERYKAEGIIFIPAEKLSGTIQTRPESAFIDFINSNENISFQ